MAVSSTASTETQFFMSETEISLNPLLSATLFESSVVVKTYLKLSASVADALRSDWVWPETASAEDLLFAINVILDEYDGV